MANLTREAVLAWLSGGGLSPDQLREALRLKEPEEVCADFRRTGRMELPEESVSRRSLELLRAGLAEENLSRVQQMISAHGIRAMTCFDEAYPSKLRDLPEAPAILFYQGNPAAAEKDSVAMVGSRSASYRCLEAARKIAERLSRNDIVIVSGLAYGIDTAAHEGCLKGKAPTVAVLGCGLDQQYPAENAPLRHRIVEDGGLILSEYAPGEKPLGRHFPWRNRIISGLGDCLAMMEARIRSGSMTTVQHALNQGKDVFVYPGEPGSPRSEGNHQLLREGGIYFTEAEDILEDMGWLDKRGDVRQNIGSSAPDSTSAVSGIDRQVLDELDRGERSFDQLCAALNLPAASLSASLSMLQIQGLIRALPGKVYQKKEGQD